MTDRTWLVRDGQVGETPKKISEILRAGHVVSVSGFRQLIADNPEIRQAVYEQDCNESGHIFNFDPVISADETVKRVRVIGVTPDNKLPHITCSRCGHVWIVIPFSGHDYKQAERQLYSLLKSDNLFAKLIVRLIGRRSNA